jgi:hypothetical protein
VSGDTPELLVVVDTEEEFDWGQPFSRDAVATRSIPAQDGAHRIYDRFGLVPTYVVDYPVATDPAAVAYLRRLMEEGRAEIGAHLHPWVTPPHREQVSTRNSYHCNLPAELERAKLEALTDAIERGFGKRPVIFKAGRYGFGPSTKEALIALGYQVDCSLLPHNDLRGDGGPNFLDAPDEPHWLDREAGLFEVPLTAGYLGRLPRLGGMMPWLFDNRTATRAHLPGLLSRSNLVTRSRLTPEGVSAREQCRLIDAMVRQGKRTFSLCYHSPSLAPGNTPYVRSDADLQDFLARIETVLTWFRDELGGRFTTLTAVRQRMLTAEQGSSAQLSAEAPVPA